MGIFGALSRRVVARLAAFVVLLATIGTGFLAATVVPAFASHFRAGQLTWERTSATSVTFEISTSFRRDFDAWTTYVKGSATGTELAPQPGDVIQDGNNTTLNFGDGTSVKPYLQVQTIDAVNDVLTAEAVHPASGTVVTAANIATVTDGVPHTFPSSTATYTAALDSCCRLGSPTDNPPGGHINNPDKSLQVSSVVSPLASTSPESSLPPIVDCPKNSPCDFSIPVALPAGTVAVYRLASGTEAIDAALDSAAFVQPVGSSVTPTGTYLWNTTGKTLAPAPLDTYYSSQVIVEAHNGTATGPIVGSVAVDFFLRITSQVDNAPVWDTTTPADGSVIDATPGQPVTIDVGASDPDSGNTVTLGVTNAPSGSTFTSSPGNPVTGTFSWTPPAVGQSVLNFTDQDNFGLQGIQRSVTINATVKTPTFVWPAPGQIVYGTPLDGIEIDASISTAPGALVPPHPGSFSYAPAAGTVLDAGDTSLQATWTPDPADALGWSATTLTQSIHVVKADQSLTFTVPVDPTVTHTFGDAPVPAVAVSTANLPVSYATGATDGCTAATQPDDSAVVTLTAAGSCTLTASQPGTADYNPAPSISDTFAIAQLTPTVTVSPLTTTYGQSLTLATLQSLTTVSPADAAGSVTYTVDGTAFTAPVVLDAGTHQVQATFTPDSSAAGANYAVGTGIGTLTVTPATQMVSFTQPADTVVGAAPFALTASASSGLTVAFTSSTGTVCAVTPDGQVTVQHVGTCTVLASQAGDQDHQAASASRSFSVGQGAQAISFTGPGNHTYGDADVAVSATGGGSNLPVTFTTTTGSVCTVDPGTTVVHIVGAGQCTVVASEGGNADWTAAPDVSQSFSVAKATPILTWSTPAPITYGTALDGSELDATVNPPISGTASYTLADGSTPATGAVLNASAAAQQLRVTFTPSGADAGNYTPVSGTSTIVVNQAAQVITVQPVAAHTFGDAPYTVSASGGGSGNPVTFSTGSAACSVAGNTVTITAAGSCVLTANQLGNSNFLAATPVVFSADVAKKTPTVLWSAPASITYGTALGATQLNASVTPVAALSAGTLTYTTDAGAGPAAGQVLHAGTHTLAAGYAPATSGAGLNYTAAGTTVQLVVAQAPQTLTFASVPALTYGGPSAALVASPGASGQPVTFSVVAGSSCSVSGSTVVATGAGTCSVTAHEAGTADYLPAPDVTRSVAVAQATQTISFTAPAAPHVGDAAITLTATGGASGNPVTFAAGPAATCTVTGKTLTITGPGTCAITASQAGNTNYAAAVPVTVSVAVAYRDCLLFDPLAQLISGVVVPFRVELCDAAGHNLSTPAVTLTGLTFDGGTPPTAPFTQPDNNFRFVPGLIITPSYYEFDIITLLKKPGAHTFTWKVAGDPTIHSVTFHTL